MCVAERGVQPKQHMTKSIKKSLFKTILTVAALACVSSANAAIINVTGDGVVISGPASTLVGATELNKQQGFNEVQGLHLVADLALDGVTVSAGTWVDSHMIFLDILGTAPLVSTNATWTFDGEVLGIMTNANEIASTGLLGLGGTIYPLTLPVSRGLEGADSYSISGSTLDLRMDVTFPGDWVRVVTKHDPQSVPDAGSTGLMFLGGLVFAVALKRRFSSK